MPRHCTKPSDGTNALNMLSDVGLAAHDNDLELRKMAGFNLPMWQELLITDSIYDSMLLGVKIVA